MKKKKVAAIEDIIGEVATDADEDSVPVIEAGYEVADKLEKAVNALAKAIKEHKDDIKDKLRKN